MKFAEIKEYLGKRNHLEDQFNCNNMSEFRNIATLKILSPTFWRIINSLEQLGPWLQCSQCQTFSY